MNITERIRKNISYFYKEQKEWAEAFELSTSKANDLARGRQEPKLDILSAIIDKHPDVNPYWLLLGRGEMLDKVVPDEVFKELTKKYIAVLEENRSLNDKYRKLLEKEKDTDDILREYIKKK